MQLGMSYSKCNTCSGTGETKELNTDKLLEDALISSQIPPLPQKTQAEAKEEPIESTSKSTTVPLVEKRNATDKSNKNKGRGKK